MLLVLLIKLVHFRFLCWFKFKLEIIFTIIIRSLWYDAYVLGFRRMLNRWVLYLLTALNFNKVFLTHYIWVVVLILLLFFLLFLKHFLLPFSFYLFLDFHLLFKVFLHSLSFDFFFFGFLFFHLLSENLLILHLSLHSLFSLIGCFNACYFLGYWLMLR